MTRDVPGLSIVITQGCNPCKPASPVCHNQPERGVGQHRPQQQTEKKKFLEKLSCALFNSSRGPCANQNYSSAPNTCFLSLSLSVASSLACSNICLSKHDLYSIIWTDRTADCRMEISFLETDAVEQICSVSKGFLFSFLYVCLFRTLFVSYKKCDKTAACRKGSNRLERNAVT